MSSEDSPQRPADSARWRADAGDLLRRLADEQALAAVEFPIYAADGIAARVCGRGRIGERITQVTLAQERGAGERLTVETALVTPTDVPEDQRVMELLDSPDATVVGRPITVNGRNVLFAFGEAGDRWAAVLYTSELNLVLTGRGIDPDAVSLLAVADPATVLS